MIYAFIGLGNMAAAILRGMQASGQFHADTLRGFDLDASKGAALQEEIGLEACESAADALQGADCAVLAVKPQHMGALLNKEREALQRVPLLISIAAALPMAFYEDILGSGALLRVMPSLLARVRGASSVVCGNAAATEADYAVAQRIFSAVGTLERVPEALIPAWAAVAGAAPAFVCQFIDALASAGLKAGMTKPQALQVACQVTMGSAKLLMESGLHPQALSDQVTSPGGTTVEGLHKLAEHGFAHAVHEAVAAVIEKDRRLSRKED